MSFKVKFNWTAEVTIQFAYKISGTECMHFVVCMPSEQQGHLVFTCYIYTNVKDAIEKRKTFIKTNMVYNAPNCSRKCQLLPRSM